MMKTRCLIIVLYSLVVPTWVQAQPQLESSPSTYFAPFADEMARARSMLKAPPALHTDKFLMEALYAGEKAYRLGRATHNQADIDTGVALYDLFMAESGTISKDSVRLFSGMFVALSWGRMTYALNEDGLLTGDRREKVRSLASGVMEAFAGTPEARADISLRDDNLAMGPLLTYSAVAAAFPDDPNAEATRRKLAAILDLHLAQGDMREESSNYEPLTIGFYLDLLRQEHRLDDLKKNPRFRRMIERWRDYASPAVFYPEAGDDYFNHEQNNFGLISCLEQAARVYDDPSMATEARRLMRRYAIAKAGGERVRGTALLELSPFRFTVAPAPLSTVYRRAVGSETGDEVWSSLVMRTGLEPGDAMIMMDLYSANSHGHLTRRPAIAYYEAGGMPLYHNLGRRAVLSGNYGNVFWTDAEADAFPGLFPPDIWNTQVVPLESLRLKSENGESIISGPIWLRYWPAKLEQAVVTFANMRLEGPAGSKVIDDFSDRSPWVSFDRKPFCADHPEWTQTVTDPVKGSAQQLAWGMITRKSNQNLVRSLPAKSNEIRFKSGSYDCVKFDFKYHAEFPYVHFRNWIGDVELGFSALPCAVADARVKQLGKDAWGRADFTRYRGAGNELSRRMALTREGILIVVDRYTPSADAARQTVGQLWQLYSLADKGDDWFASNSDGFFPQVDGVARPERRMLVKYHVAPGTTCGSAETTPGVLNPYRLEDGKKVPHKSFWTTYSKTTLPGDGRSFTAVQVVYPLLKDADTEKAASAIQFAEIGDGIAKVRMPTEDKQIVEITLGGDGATVRRTPD